MELTEVRINLCGEGGSRLKAFCSLTFDNTFVIRDVKLIDGNDGLFLAMPSRKLCDHCPSCKDKNQLRPPAQREPLPPVPQRQRERPPRDATEAARGHRPPDQRGVPRAHRAAGDGGLRP